MFEGENDKIAVDRFVTDVFEDYKKCKLFKEEELYLKLRKAFPFIIEHMTGMYTDIDCYVDITLTVEDYKFIQKFTYGGIQYDMTRIGEDGRTFSNCGSKQLQEMLEYDDFNIKYEYNGENNLIVTYDFRLESPPDNGTHLHKESRFTHFKGAIPDGQSLSAIMDWYRNSLLYLGLYCSPSDESNFRKHIHFQCKYDETIFLEILTNIYQHSYKSKGPFSFIIGIDGENSSVNCKVKLPETGYYHRKLENSRYESYNEEKKCFEYVCTEIQQKLNPMDIIKNL